MLERMKKLLGTARETAGDEAQATGSPATTESEVSLPGAIIVDGDSVAASAEAQSLRVELLERDRLIQTLKQELERARSGEQERVHEIVEARLERLMSGAAAPVAQLLTQIHLFEAEGKPVQTKDVLAVAKRIVRALEDEGLSILSGVGETVAFDPNYHQPLGTQGPLAQSEKAVVRLVGISYRGKVLRKASVEKVG